MIKDNDLDLDELDLSPVDPKPTVEQPTAAVKPTSHIDWNQNIPTKINDNSSVVQNPNNFYKQNLQFLTGQKSGQNKENVKRPIFRLGIILDSGPNSLAKRIFVPNSTNSAEIDNVPSDYYNIIQPENVDNLSVFFIDFTFEWITNNEGINEVKPVWVTNVQQQISQVIEDQSIRLRPTKSMPKFDLMPYGKAQDNLVYTNDNPFCRKFWKEIRPSFDYNKDKYSNIYTIWFQKKYFGFNVLEEIFADTTYKKQVKEFKDIYLNKKIIDLFDLSDLITPNEPLSKKNDIFLLFTKWLNYKTTSMSSSSDVFNKKFLESAKTETIGIDFFKRIDDFMYYTSKCFINILDQCLYVNFVNQLGAKGILLEDFFIKEHAVGGTNQDTTQEFIDFVDDKKEELDFELEKPQNTPSKTSKPKSKPKKKSPAPTTMLNWDDAPTSKPKKKAVKKSSRKTATKKGSK